MESTPRIDLARGRQRTGGDPKLLYLRHELRGWEWSGIGHCGSPLRQWNEDPGAAAKRRSAFAEMFLSLRRHDPDQVRRVSAPRSQMELDSRRRYLSPLPGHPLDTPIIRRLGAARQGYGFINCEGRCERLAGRASGSM